MKAFHLSLITVATALLLVPARGQGTGTQKTGKDQQTANQNEQPNSTNTQPGTPLRIQVVFTEFNGAKKISSLPYTLYGVTHGSNGGAPIRLRYNVYYAHGLHDNVDIDCRISPKSAGRYKMDFNVARDWVPGTSEGTVVAPSGSASSDHEGLVIPSFTDTFSVEAGSGETVEGASAVDPLTGHVLKIEVILTALK